jgi:hypothetical protein
MDLPADRRHFSGQKASPGATRRLFRLSTKAVDNFVDFFGGFTLSRGPERISVTLPKYWATNKSVYIQQFKQNFRCQAICRNLLPKPGKLCV